MPAQFFHLSAYGRSPRRGAKRHESCAGILGEASRLAPSSAHIEEPRQPRRLLGFDPVDLRPEIDRLAYMARDSRGRRLRTDAGLMIAGVISYPVLRSEIASPDDWLTYLEWRKASVEWLTRQFGQSLKSIVEHEDEAYRHIHAFMLPDLAPDGQMDWTIAHPARHARVAAAQKGRNKTEQNAAYIAAVRALADDFHDTVSRHFGHDRVTVRRDRRSRTHHLEIQTYQQRVDDAVRQIDLLARERDALLAALADGDAGRLPLAGHSDALKVLEIQLFSLGDSGSGEDLPLSDPPAGASWDWGGDDDPRPDVDLDVDCHDDDPDPEAPDAHHVPGDRDDDPDYGDQIERFEDVDPEG